MHNSMNHTIQGALGCLDDLGERRPGREAEFAGPHGVLGDERSVLRAEGVDDAGERVLGLHGAHLSDLAVAAPTTRAR